MAITEYERKTLASGGGFSSTLVDRFVWLGLTFSSVSGEGDEDNSAESTGSPGSALEIPLIQHICLFNAWIPNKQQQVRSFLAVVTVAIRSINHRFFRVR